MVRSRQTLHCERCERGRLYPTAKPSLLLIVPRIPRRAGRESLARYSLYFVGYVTAYPRHCANAPSGLATLSPPPTALRRTPKALRGTAPPRLSCFVQENQDARYLPECVEGANPLKNVLGARFDPRSDTKYAGFGAFGARFVVAIGSMPTFSTGWCILRSSRSTTSRNALMAIFKVCPPPLAK